MCSFPDVAKKCLRFLFFNFQIHPGLRNGRVHPQSKHQSTVEVDVSGEIAHLFDNFLANMIVSGKRGLLM